ncbi:hypothetical protein ACJJIU_22170 (plasmid) [Microbulbifer sp. CnH-101-E]|uniref:hypothetical protein n=1 Tax=unclassified Microbulbifer TaxID=2619833 RepID=UPI004039E424
MSFWSRLWGSEKALEKGADALIKTGDALFYTAEEKAQDSDQRNAQVREFLLQWIKSTSGQNIARRLIAIAFSAVYLLLVLLVAALSILSALAGQDGNALAAAASAAWGLLVEVTSLQGLIMFFYFAPNKIGEAIATFKGRVSADKA